MQRRQTGQTGAREEPLHDRFGLVAEGVSGGHQATLVDLARDGDQGLVARAARGSLEVTARHRHAPHEESDTSTRRCLLRGGPLVVDGAQTMVDEAHAQQRPARGWR